MKPIYRLLFIGLLLSLVQLACWSVDADWDVPPQEPSEPQAPSEPQEPSQPPDPEPVPTQGVIPPVETESPPQPGVSEARMLTVEFPPRIRAGDSYLVRLTLEVDARGNLTATAETAGNVTRGEVIQIPDIYETHYVIAETRLDMAGIQVSPPGLVSESLRPGQSLTFYWSVRAEQVGIYRGTLWFYLRYVPLNGGFEQRQALSAQRIEIEAVNFFGLNAQPARWLGTAGMLVSFVLGKPLFGSAFNWLWRKKFQKPLPQRSNLKKTTRN
jgi:hypothetical protein